jgi:hypothetical protein
MQIKKINDPFILNVKIELEGVRASLKYRTRLQCKYKKEFSNSQRSKDGKSKLYSAMMVWNRLYINKLLATIDEYKETLDELYESERKLLYLGKGREDKH